MYSSKGRGGAYYKNKYGRGGGGGKPEGGGVGGRKRQLSQGGSYDDLRETLRRIDHKPYGFYHDMETGHSGGWKHDDFFTLQILRAQSDPFAPPTRCRLVIPFSKTQIPDTFLSTTTRRMATADYLWRRLFDHAKTMGVDRKLENGKGWSGPKGGDIHVLPPTQHAIEQTAVFLEESSNDTILICQMTINLPAQGRTIMGDVATHIFDRLLPKLVQASFYVGSLHDIVHDMQQHVDVIEDQVWLQDQLEREGLVCFVLNGAILPRQSGVDDRPLLQGLENAVPVVPFQSPPSLERSFTLPNTRQTISGMGIPEGITLICGGGFHGKSTLLECLQLGVYAKIPGDGREFCVTRKNASKIRAEDGRFISNVDISSFIKNLPFQKDTTRFTTNDASGSTSQASNIVEVRLKSLLSIFCHTWRLCIY
jgi:predicted ABC-class ATPase